MEFLEKHLKCCFPSSYTISIDAVVVEETDNFYVVGINTKFTQAINYPEQPWRWKHVNIILASSLTYDRTNKLTDSIGTLIWEVHEYVSFIHLAAIDSQSVAY